MFASSIRRFVHRHRPQTVASAPAATAVLLFVAAAAGDASSSVSTGAACEDKDKEGAALLRPPSSRSSSGSPVQPVVDLRGKINGVVNGALGGSPLRPDEGPDALPPEEARVVATFERVAPSVAYVQTTAVVQQYRRHRHRPFSELRETEIPAGTGSGFLYDAEGRVITNYHVIAGAVAAGGRGGDLGEGKVKVKCHGMAEARDATILGVDPDRDLAVLEISRDGGGALPAPIELGSSNGLRVGQTVLAIGNPFGLDTTLTTGVVSALGRDLMGAGGRPIRGCIQMSAAINPGNSGGPLLDSRGRLIGVNMAMISPGGGGGNVGIGFAIPSQTVKRVVNQIIKHGRVVRPTLGVSMANDRVVQSIGKQLGVELDGVLVMEVAPGGPADVAGVASTKLRWDGTVDLGDLIVRFGDSEISNNEDLLEAIEQYRDGDTIAIEVRRGCDPTRTETLHAKLTGGSSNSSSRGKGLGTGHPPRSGGHRSMVSN